MEPLPRAGNLSCKCNIGGAIPRNYIRVEKGIRGSAGARIFGRVSGMVDFPDYLYDGSYPRVDSNDLSFQVAGRIALFAKGHGRWRADAVWRPGDAVAITAPDEFAGSIMGDLNSRRGRIQAWQQRRNHRPG